MPTKEKNDLQCFRTHKEKMEKNDCQSHDEKEKGVIVTFFLSIFPICVRQS